MYYSFVNMLSSLVFRWKREKIECCFVFSQIIIPESIDEKEFKMSIKYIMFYFSFKAIVYAWVYRWERIKAREKKLQFCLCFEAVYNWVKGWAIIEDNNQISIFFKANIYTWVYRWERTEAREKRLQSLRKRQVEGRCQ